MARHIIFLAFCACGRVGFDDVDLGLADASLDAPASCPSGYEPRAGSCYRFAQNIPNSGAWLDAEAVCEAEGPGTHLVVIDNASELTLMLDELRARDTVDAAIGFSDRTLEGDYRAVTGAPAFLVWAPANPDGDNDCGALSVAESGSGMKDSACDGRFNDYICEYDGVAADPTAF